MAGAVAISIAPSFPVQRPTLNFNFAKSSTFPDTISGQHLARQAFFSAHQLTMAGTNEIPVNIIANDGDVILKVGGDECLAKLLVSSGRLSQASKVIAIRLGID